MRRYYLYLLRGTSLKLTKDEIKDFLKCCKEENEEPTPFKFLEWKGAYYNYYYFDETVESTEIDNSNDFSKLIEEVIKEQI